MAAPTDIRASRDAGYWSQFAATWTTLLTYRYLGRVNPVLDQGVERVTMPLRHDMRDSEGRVMAAPLAIAAAESGGMHDDLYIPNPVTASLDILDDALGVTRVRVLPDTIRLGRTMGFSRSLIVDDDDPARVIALSSGTAISLGSPPPGYRPVDNPPLEVADSPDMPRLHQVFNIRPLAGGEWQLPALGTGTASPDAALHLGPQHIALETAAGARMRREFGAAAPRIRHWQVMFVARGKVGPFVTRSELIDGQGGGVAVRVALLDSGNEQRVISSATAIY